MKKLSSLLLALMACVTFANAKIFERIQIGDLYYNLNTETKTAEVTTQNSSYPYWSTVITTADIPSSVTYNKVAYNVTSISEGAFAGCSALTSVTIPNSVTSIEESAFLDCTALTSVTISNSVTSIGHAAFYNCTGLTSVTIPSSVTSIGTEVFVDCTGLTSISVDANNPNFCDIDGVLLNKEKTELLYYPINKSASSYTIPVSVTNIKSFAFYGCTKLTSVTIPNSVNIIQDAAFWGCTGLTSVTIPNSVTSLGVWAFRECASLTSISVDANNPNYCDIDGVLFNKEKTELRLYPAKKPGSSYTIPVSVTNIESFVFSGCTKLTSVTIPKTATKIGSGAFEYCTGLTSVTIPNGVISISSSVFKGCSSLTSVTIPKSVVSISNGAFSGCSALTSVTIPSRITQISVRSFYGCTGLTSITCEAVTPPSCLSEAFYDVSRSIPLYVPANSVSTYKSKATWKTWGDNIKPIQAEEAEVTAPHATPTENSVVLDWPIANDAVGYTIYIKKGDLTICSLSFNALGQLLTIAFAAPARDGNSRQTPAATQTSTGWQYTISDLDPDTEYTYTVIAKRSDESEAYNETVPFKTTGIATSLNQTSQEPIANSQKLIKNGQILILRGEKVYTVTGQEVK